MYFWLRRCVIAVVVAVGFATTALHAADSKTNTDDPDFIRVDRESALVPAIGTCLGQNKEAVLLADHVQCTPYRAGTSHLAKEAPNAPFDVSLARDCPAAPPSGHEAQQGNAQTPFNARRLPADALDQIIKDFASTIGAHGIRILGALFCERLNLVGLDLPYSLILDRSVFKEGIEIRNFRTKGDFSVDGSLVFNQLKIVRSYFEGSVFGDRSFIKGLAVIDTTVAGSAFFRESVLFHLAHFEGARIARVLSIRASALSFFLTQFSSVGGLLELSHSEARCAYYINKSEIGFFVANRVGFGTIAPLSNQGDAAEAIYSWKRAFSITDAVKRTLTSEEVRKVVGDAEPCESESIKYRAEFFLFDSKVHSSLCINEFQWLSPRAADLSAKEKFSAPSEGSKLYLRTIVALDGNTIGNNLIVNLWSDKRTIHDEVSADLHKFEAIGLKTAGFVFNFDDNKRHYFTALDGLEFERIYSAQAACEYAGSEPAPAGGPSDGTPSIISELKAQLDIPTVDEVLKWLELNKLGSTQPYTAFANAFERAGADSTQIKVARSNREVCERAAHWLLLPIIRPFCRGVAERHEGGPDQPPRPGTETSIAGPAPQLSGWSQLGAALSAIPDLLSDLAQLLFRGALYFLADHGYRPGKVIWWVTITLIVFWAMFLLWLRVVAFSPTTKTPPDQPPSNQQAPTPDTVKLRPIGLLFLLDRLLPSYKISSANYDIGSYYKRIPISEVANRTPPPRFVRRALFFHFPVEPVVDEAEIARVNRLLLILRLLGVVFTVFLAAAIGALVVH
jgi:hypothetical protein